MIAGARPSCASHWDEAPEAHRLAQGYKCRIASAIAKTITFGSIQMAAHRRVGAIKTGHWHQAWAYVKCFAPFSNLHGWFSPGVGSRCFFFIFVVFPLSQLSSFSCFPCCEFESTFVLWVVVALFVVLLAHELQ